MSRKVTSDDTGGRWALGIAENVTPGFVNSPHTHFEPEAFYVLESTYEFLTEEVDRSVASGSLVVIPAGVRHGFIVGPDGGKLVCVGPAAFDGYFTAMNEAVAAGTATPQVMNEIAGRHGMRNLPWPEGEPRPTGPRYHRSAGT